VPVVLDLVPRERQACDLIRYFVLLASSKAAPCRWIDADADYGLLFRIFRHRILVPRLIPLAQGPPSACARILRFGRRPRF
jgi:hypothetical protein